jgi:hypothetical protein
MTDDRPLNRRGGRKRERPIVSIGSEDRDEVGLAVAAAFLKMHPRTLLARIEAGRIDAFFDAGKWYVSVASVRFYDEQRRHRISA